VQHKTAANKAKTQQTKSPQKSRVLIKRPLTQKQPKMEQSRRINALFINIIKGAEVMSTLAEKQNADDLPWAGCGYGFWRCAGLFAGFC
jgi:hypothetical protein